MIAYTCSILFVLNSMIWSSVYSVSFVGLSVFSFHSKKPMLLLQAVIRISIVLVQLQLSFSIHLHMKHGNINTLIEESLQQVSKLGLCQCPWVFKNLHNLSMSLYGNFTVSFILTNLLTSNDHKQYLLVFSIGF